MGTALQELAAHCSVSTDQPDEELPVPQQALASITHEHHVHHSAVLPLLPGCSCLPLLHHLVVSTHEATAQGLVISGCQLPGEGGLGTPWPLSLASPSCRPGDAAPGRGGASRLLAHARFLQLFLVQEAGMRTPSSSPGDAGDSEAEFLEGWTSETGHALGWGQ